MVQTERVNGMRIAIFGGSFDPVHNEHIRLVRAAIDSLRLDRLFVVPAFAPPHKKGKTLTADKDRLEMCRLAFAGFERVEVCDYEIAKGGTSFTYLTCKHFRALYPTADIFFLVGTDMLRDFPTWKHPEQIVKTVTLAVCARDEKQGWADREREIFREKFGCDFALIDYNGAPVSSTEIRVLAGAGMDLTEYTDEKTAAYIVKNNLYEIPRAKEALELEKESRRLHSIRVAKVAAKKAPALGIDEKKAITAALFHDCAKNLDVNAPQLQGFIPPQEWGEIPAQVLHQFAGAYVAERAFGVTDREVLNAIRFHTSARENMSELEKLIFLADMVEEERVYEGVDVIRELFWNTGAGAGALDRCLEKALQETVLYLNKKGEKIYPLTLRAYAFYKQN